ncbi:MULTISPECIES: IS630 family transposase [unclassified Synechococcus]|uniref:IS630 family transposase n=1 Tax=unclassified Synechococcus TaxID=2626047 RepID=UPI00055DB5A9|nr:MULTISPECIES: IS630 family transposase [unclassified Synechococcus]WFN57756.1 IS630 family transposase [Synechococcus sp. CCFWC 502]WFN57952.1 IS630 family transposase [Synechococcus sp. CCFWC 502]WFN60022.1 IS630 family transposase [Synechococcus sp. CCFWC 502]WFN60078.1 IS630 family transposase [Synechococcus sp. CCFWC 502]
MPVGRPMAPLELSADEVSQLKSLAGSRTLPHSIVQRAQIVLACAAGETNTAVAERFCVRGSTVGKWRQRYLDLGIEGLHDELRPGRPRTYEDDRVAEVINRALQTKPTDGSTHWSARTLAAATGISKTTVHRWLQTFSVQPHRQKHFKLSTDPFFVEKVRDIVGLYLNPPDKAMVLCVDEKTQIQALDRTQPLLPMGLGYVEGVTHDYIRHGTTTLFAALDVGTGEVITQCKPRHRHQEFLGFLRQIEKSVPEDLDVHLIVDNYCTHKHVKVRAWLAQRPRFHVHYTPTYASWLNQVERWFGIITQRAIRRGSFSSVKELIAKIEQFVAAYNKTKVPFNWTATADSILEKLQRLCAQISGTGH